MKLFGLVVAGIVLILVNAYIATNGNIEAMLGLLILAFFCFGALIAILWWLSKMAMYFMEASK